MTSDLETARNLVMHFLCIQGPKQIYRKLAKENGITETFEEAFASILKSRNVSDGKSATLLSFL